MSAPASVQESVPVSVLVSAREWDQAPEVEAVAAAGAELVPAREPVEAAVARRPDRRSPSSSRPNIQRSRAPGRCL